MKPQPRPLDQIDRDLIALLQTNARESVANLARRVGVARTTVIARIARMEANEVIAGYGVRLGQGVLDGSLHAYVGITLRPNSAKEVLRKFAKMQEIQLLCAVSGEYDYVAWLRAASPQDLDGLLDLIGAIDGIQKTTTSIILSRKIDRFAKG